MDANVLKVAVDTQYGRQLYNFDQRIPLKAIINELSKNSQDAETMALVWVDNSMYLNEYNRNKVINGALLKLVGDPKHEVNKIILNLKSSHTNDQAYAKMAEIVKDGTMSELFLKGNGLDIVVHAINKGKCTDFQFDKLMSTLLELLDTRESWEKTVTPHILAQVVKKLHEMAIHSEELHSSTLSFIENAITISDKTYYMLCDVPFTIRDVKRQINMSQFQNTQARALAVVNAMITRKSQQDHAGLKEIRQCVLNNIIRSTNKANSEISQQLYTFQVLCLNKLSTKMMQKPNPNDRILKESILELTRLAFDNLTESSPSGKRTVSTSSLGDSADIANLGFSNRNNPLLDFVHTPPGLLSLDCMNYFANTHQNDYIRLVLENSSSSAKSYQRPFAKSSIELVKTLCDIFKIGEPPMEHCSNYHPLLFTHEHIFEEMFSIGIMLLNKTWKEMSAISEDFDKVLSVVREQIELALASTPSSTDQFKLKLQSLSYKEISEIRQSDSHAKEKFVAKAKPVVELQEKVKSELVLLIEEQRIGCIMSGSPFQRVMTTNKKYRNKMPWFCRLSANKRYLHHGDYDEAEQKIEAEDLSNKIDVLEIIEVFYGKSCPHVKSMKAVGKGSSATLAISIQYEPEEFLNLIAPDTETFNIWMDGLSKVTGGNIQSDLVKSDMEMLLSMEMKLRLLDIETLTIPDQPPPMPPLPADLKFAT